MNKGEKRIVVNTSPWIALSICGQNHLLKILYDEICIPVKVKLPVLPHGASSQLRRNPPKHTLLRSFGASKSTLFAFIPVLPDGAFCEGG